MACLKPPRKALQGRTACEKNGQATPKNCAAVCRVSAIIWHGVAQEISEPFNNGVFALAKTVGVACVNRGHVRGAYGWLKPAYFHTDIEVFPRRNVLYLWIYVP